MSDLQICLIMLHMYFSGAITAYLILEAIRKK